MKPIVLAVASDIHAGSTVAVCPPRIQLDDGGAYEASKAQKWLWACWLDYWEQVEATRKKHSAELYAVLNGDLVDGQVKHSTQILSGNPNAQAAALDACMGVVLEKNPERIFVVRGTEAHTGNSASAEERIASGLLKDKRPIVGDPDTGTASWWHLRMELQGVRVDITHHGRTGQREHTRGSAAVLHAHDVLLSHVKNGDEYPHICIRAHHHKFNDSGDACPVRVVTSGAWQLKTGYVHKVAADSLADIGGLVVVINDGKYTVEKVHYRAQRGSVWKP